MADYRENAIEFYNDEKVATVTFAQGRYKSKIQKLAQERPTECEIVAENDDGTIVAHIPVRWVRVSPPRKVSEKEKNAAAERFRRYREENVIHET